MGILNKNRNEKIDTICSVYIRSPPPLHDETPAPALRSRLSISRPRQPHDGSTAKSVHRVKILVL